MILPFAHGFPRTIDHQHVARLDAVARYSHEIGSLGNQPTHNLRWLHRMIQNAQSWPPYHYGWEVHQASYRGHEVFVLHLCRYCGNSRGFLLYNHHGELIARGEGADSLAFATLPGDRILAVSAGRFRMQP